MNNKELTRRALMGEKQAQGLCTAKGIMLPCPFCGGKATMQQDITGRESYHVVCSNVKDMCNLIAGLPMWSESEEDALKVWNTRPAPPIGRCGECKHFNHFFNEVGHCMIHSQEKDLGGNGYHVEMLKTDYCSYFESREELL